MRHYSHMCMNCCLLFTLLPYSVLADSPVNNRGNGKQNDPTPTDAVIEETANLQTQSMDTLDGINPPQKNDSENVATEEVVQSTSVLRVEVLQHGEDSRPIKNARVIITHENATEYERKTDSSGLAKLDGLPYGKIDVDVISSGRTSGGTSFVIDEPSETIKFELKPRLLSE